MPGEYVPQQYLPILIFAVIAAVFGLGHGAKAAAYVDASMNNINWANAARLYEECIK